MRLWEVYSANTGRSYGYFWGESALEAIEEAVLTIHPAMLIEEVLDAREHHG